MNRISIKNQLSVLVVLFALFCFACGGGAEQSGSTNGKETVKEASKEHGDTPAHTAAYVCPMHCEGTGSDKPGVCPVCGMDYDALADHTKNGHTH